MVLPRHKYKVKKESEVIRKYYIEYYRRDKGWMPWKFSSQLKIMEQMLEHAYYKFKKVRLVYRVTLTKVLEIMEQSHVD